MCMCAINDIWVCDMIDSPINLDFWGPKSSVKNENCLVTYIDYLFIVTKDCVEPATLFGWSYNKGRILIKCSTEALEQHSSGFEFRLFLSPKLVALPRLKSTGCPTIYQ